MNKNRNNKKSKELRYSLEHTKKKLIYGLKGMEIASKIGADPIEGLSLGARMSDEFEDEDNVGALGGGAKAMRISNYMNLKMDPLTQFQYGVELARYNRRKNRNKKR
jgi:hypothetical protein